MNLIKEATIQEINLDPNKKYLLCFYFEQDPPRDTADKIMTVTKDRLCCTCDVPMDNVIPLPFGVTLKDISIEEAQPIRDLLDKMIEDKNDLQ